MDNARYLNLQVGDGFNWGRATQEQVDPIWEAQEVSHAIRVLKTY